jgi:dynein heavy chain, axonemal
LQQQRCRAADCVALAGVRRWQLLQPEGKAPEPRMDHSALMYPVQPNSDTFDKLIIMGGRDLQQYFEDAHMLELSEDLDAIRWSTSAVPCLQRAICNNCCDSIESVPYHKMFSFGGKKGGMDYMNSVEVLDAGTEQWSSPCLISHPVQELMAAPPSPREDSAWVYDNKRSALVLFGGWSNRWLGDMWRLNAAAIIGPPYACVGIQPASGPVFGTTELEITGLRFQEGAIQVKFSTGKNEAVTDGIFVNQTTIKVLTPNFETFGPQQVDVVLQISGEGWTVQKQTFTYFANTTGRNCLAYGPAVLQQGVYGIEMPFVIQVRRHNYQRCGCIAAPGCSWIHTQRCLVCCRLVTLQIASDTPAVTGFPSALSWWIGLKCMVELQSWTRALGGTNAHTQCQCLGATKCM